MESTPTQIQANSPHPQELNLSELQLVIAAVLLSLTLALSMDGIGHVLGKGRTCGLIDLLCYVSDPRCVRMLRANLDSYMLVASLQKCYTSRLSFLALGILRSWHAIALDQADIVWDWGVGRKNQLGYCLFDNRRHGRRISEGTQP